jgi:hypothetical protein
MGRGSRSSRNQASNCPGLTQCRSAVGDEELEAVEGQRIFPGEADVRMHVHEPRKQETPSSLQNLRSVDGLLGIESLLGVDAPGIVHADRDDPVAIDTDVPLGKDLPRLRIDDRDVPDQQRHARGRCPLFGEPGSLAASERCGQSHHPWAHPPIRAGAVPQNPTVADSSTVRGAPR